MPTLTPNIKLQKPADAEFGWQNMLRQNSDTLDAEITALKGGNQITGTATGGSATTMVDAGLTLGVDAFAGGGVVIIHRGGVLLRAESIISNTPTTLTFASGIASQAGDTYSIASQAGASGVANGLATLDGNTELVELPAGAAAEVAAGRTNSVPRADGTWSARVRHLYDNYPLQTWADDLALGAYAVKLTVAQNGLPAGWWYIEVIRHIYDAAANQFRYLRATPIDSPLGTMPVYHCSDVGGTWSAWTPMDSKGLGDGQTWQDKTASRASSVTYTNTTGRSISVIIDASNNAVGSYTYLHLTIDGIVVANSNNTTFQPTNFNHGCVTAIIPDGATYSCVVSFGILMSWMELR